MTELLPKHVLCYVDGRIAYFTNCPLDKQWGDDWNDAPYEHNAGSPYEWIPWRLEKEGVPEYTIVTVMFECANLKTPAERAYNGNSAYSVEAINRGDVAWLSASPDKKFRPVPAGVTVAQFKRLIWAADGDIYERVEPTQEDVE